jgi:hypothetical protein
VDQPGRVHRTQAGEQPFAQGQDLVVWQRATKQQTLQGRAIDVFHHQIQSLLVPQQFVTPNQAIVIQLRQRPGLADEQLFHLRAEARVAPYHLDRTRFAEVHVPGAVDTSHSTATDFGDDLVCAKDARARSEGTIFPDS